METYVREEWVKASEGVSVSAAELLEAIESRIRAAADPWVLFDLDHTLLETVKRTHRILVDAADKLELDPEIVRKVRLLHPEQMGFSLQDTFTRWGLPSEGETFDAIREFWWERFFGEDFLHHDEAFPGAVEFAERLHRAGAHLCYLTARVETRMGKGTRATLARLGFPWDTSRTSLHMKATDEQSDHGHKGGVREVLPSTATVVASFENEPRNVVELMEAFPEALHVFVDTKCSVSPARPCPGIRVLKTFHSHTK